MKGLLSIHRTDQLFVQLGGKLVTVLAVSALRHPADTTDGIGEKKLIGSGEIGCGPCLLGHSMAGDGLAVLQQVISHHATHTTFG